MFGSDPMRVLRSRKSRICRLIFTQQMSKAGGPITKGVGFNVGMSTRMSFWRDEWVGVMPLC